MDSKTSKMADGNNAESAPQNNDSVSEQIAHVRAAALALLSKAEGAENAADMANAVEKAAAALKLAVDMGKVHADLDKINEEIVSLKRQNETAPKRERSERLRDYVALFTPLVTIITLAATLVVQTWQFLRSERNKQEDAINMQWQDAVKTISASGALSPGVLALQPFLPSQKYGPQATNVAVNFLAKSSDMVDFTNLFRTALTPVSWSNMEAVVRLDRALHARFIPLNDKANKKGITGLSEKDYASFIYVTTGMRTITSQIGSLLKTARPPKIQVDLSATHLLNGDWQGINLSGVIFESALLNWMNLRDAEFDVTRFYGVDLWGTAWWEVKSINRPFLDYLQKRYPFKPGVPYGPNGKVFSQTDYDAAIVRLTSQLK